MKVTVELSEKEMEDVLKFSGKKKKGPAIRKLLVDSLMLRRRAALTERIVSGELSAEIPDWEKLRELNREEPWQR